MDGSCGMNGYCNLQYQAKVVLNSEIVGGAHLFHHLGHGKT